MSSYKNKLKNMARRAFAALAPTVAQAGQDAWVINEVHNRLKRGYFVEIGSHDGLELSNTYLLEKRYGWSGLCIEANPVTFEQLQKTRVATCLNVCVDQSGGWVDFRLDGMMGGIKECHDSNTEDRNKLDSVIRLRTETLLTLLEDNNAPCQIDYLSIDVEGAEDRILSNFDFDRYRFLAITIERPSTFVDRILLANGYLKVAEIPHLDAFYIHRSHSRKYFENVLAVGRKRRLLMSR